MVILTVRVNKALLNEVKTVQNETLRNFTIISYCFKEVNFPNSAERCTIESENDVIRFNIMVQFFYTNTYKNCPEHHFCLGQNYFCSVKRKFKM